jgi:hypothetical protein
MMKLEKSAILGTLCLVFASTAFGVEILEDVDEQKYDVNPDVTLSVSNTDGSIRIYGADQPVITIEAIKRAYDPERLEAIVVDVKASRDQIVVTTKFPPRKNAVSDRSGTVDYNIVVPQTARIVEAKLVNGELLVDGLREGGTARAHITNGWLLGHNCFGDLDLTVETGRLDVAYDWWENREFAIKALTNVGSIHATFPGDSSINLSARAPEGRIANGFDSRKTGAGDVIHSVAEVTGPDAAAVVSLEARRGNIRIDKLY